MKTYTKKEFIKYYGDAITSRLEDGTYSYWRKLYQRCGCLALMGTKNFYAYKHCTNCEGFGRPPIPRSEIE